VASACKQVLNIKTRICDLVTHTCNKFRISERKDKHPAGFRPGVVGHEFMENREAFARAIDKKLVACPYINSPPFVLSDKWLDSEAAIAGGKPRKLYDICAQACKEHALESSGMALVNNLTTAYVPCRAAALLAMRTHQQQTHTGASTSASAQAGAAVSLDKQSQAPLTAALGYHYGSQLGP